MPNRLYLCADRYSPAYSRIAGDYPRNWFPASKVNGMGKLESFNAVSSLILGQSENFIAYKDILGKISRNRMYTMAATAMSTVSMSIVGAS